MGFTIESLEAHTLLSIAPVGYLPQTAHQMMAVADHVGYSNEVDSIDGYNVAVLSLKTGKTTTLVRGMANEPTIYSVNNRLLVWNGVHLRSYDVDANTSVQIDGSFDDDATVLGDWLVSATTSGQVWRTDGTKKGTVKMADFSSNDEVGPDLTRETPVRLGDKIVFPTQGYYSSVPNGRLYITDGTKKGSHFNEIFSDRIPDFNVVLPFRDKLVISLNTPIEGDSLFLSDGTLAGTRAFSDIAVADSESIVATGNTIAWLGDGVDSGREIWTSNGTRKGTKLAEDWGKGDASAFDYDQIQSFTLKDNGLYFSARYGDKTEVAWTADHHLLRPHRNPDNVPGGILMKIDAATSKASVISAGAADDVIDAGAGRLAFTGSDSLLWESRGTPDTTTKIGANVEWKLSTPLGVAFAIGDDVYLDRIDPKNAEATRSVVGRVYEPGDTDNVYSPGADSPLPSQRVYADLDNDGKRDKNEPSAMTKIDGSYFLVGLPADKDATIRLGTVAVGYRTVGPTHATARTSRGNVVDLDFFVRKPVGTLTVEFFNDLNQNGIRDVGENKLALHYFDIEFDTADSSGFTEVSGETNSKGSFQTSRDVAGDGTLVLEAPYKGFHLPKKKATVRILLDKHTFATIGLQR